MIDVSHSTRLWLLLSCVLEALVVNVAMHSDQQQSACFVKERCFGAGLQLSSPHMRVARVLEVPSTELYLFVKWEPRHFPGSTLKIYRGFLVSVNNFVDGGLSI